MKRLLPLFLALLCVVCCAPLFAVEAEDTPIHAPYFVNVWDHQGEFEVLSVDWYCETNAEATYWAVMEWSFNRASLEGKPLGYAGFQTGNMTPMVLMSCWDLPDGTHPRIEYAGGGLTNYFTNEGSGQQVFTEYPWKEKTWYTMRIQLREDGGRSYIEQWVKEKGGDWTLCAVMSYPRTDLAFSNILGFQEDFGFNNYCRKQRLKNFYGKYKNGQWQSLSSQLLLNDYAQTGDDAYSSDPLDPYFKGSQHNVTFNCDWGIKNDYLWIETGGSDDFSPNGLTLPITYTLKQAKEPLETKFLDQKRYLENIWNANQDEVQQEIDIDWNCGNTGYDILTFELCCKNTHANTEYRLPQADQARFSFNVDDSNQRYITGFLNLMGPRIKPKIEWVTKRYQFEKLRKNPFAALEIRYPWKDDLWYTVRVQRWEKDGKSYFGQWIREQYHNWELLAVYSYPDSHIYITHPKFKALLERNKGEKSEFRLRKAYGRTKNSDSWTHWVKYPMNHRILMESPYTSEFPRVICNTSCNLESGRHHDYVWCRIGSDGSIKLDKHFPFTYRIKGEKTAPHPHFFIKDYIPNNLRPDD